MRASYSYNWKRCLAFLFIVLLLASVAPVTSFGAQPVTVRVGIFDYNGFYGKDESGNPYGYGYEYLDILGRYAGFRYEYRHGSWSECLEMLQKGEIDILDSAQWTEERSKLFAYSKYATGTSFAEIFVREDNTSIAFNDFEAMNGIRIGLLRDDNRNILFRDYSRKKGFVAEEVMYNTIPELADALQKVEVDAIVTSNLRRGDKERSVARFDPIPYYFIMNKENTALYDLVNDAMEQMLMENPNFIAQLNMKYYSTESNPLVLTKKEKEFINKLGTLKVVFDSYWPPFESYNEGTGEPEGINVDAFNLITEKIGLNYEFLSGYDYEQAIQAVGEKSVDMLLSYDTNPQKAAELNMLLSNNFLSTPISIVGKKYRVSADSVFAIPTTYTLPMRFVKEHFPDNKIIKFDDITECYEAIKDDKADFTLENIYAATDAIESGKYGGLLIASVTPLMDKFSFAFRSDIDPMLINIMNKAIMTVTDAEMDSLLLAYTTNKVAASGLEMAKNYDRQRAIISVSAMIIVFISMCYVIFMQFRNKKSLWRMAYIDELTGFSNYNKFKKDAEKLLLYNNNLGYICTIIDVDNFKLINEMQGFAEGDRIIKGMSKAIESVLNPTLDTFGRIYSDHFVILKSYPISEDGERLEEETEEEFLKALQSQLGQMVTFRFGRYFLDKNETDLVEVLEKANYAHSVAKEQVHSNVCNYDDALRRVDIREKQIENKMENALLSNQFKVYLQAKYSLADETVIGAEALVRWQEDDKDFIYPSEFIPLFEKNGFIIKLDMYMFKKACEIIRHWIDKDLPLITISVNFSRLHLKNENFVKEIIEIADGYRVPKRYLEVEITESTMLDNELALEDILVNLHAAGFTLSMDDFGTGYSSLGLLKNLPVDVIKIDRSFFAENKYKNRARTVIINVIKMAKELGIHTIAEGVESFEHIEFLREMGCDAVQGYYYAKPISADSFSTQSIVVKHTDSEIIHNLSMEAIGNIDLGRGSLGVEMPVAVYRLFQLAIREAITQRGGDGEMVETLRQAGKIAGSVFAQELLDVNLPFAEFMSNLADKLMELKIGILKAENFNADTGSAVFTVSNDLDCSGMPNTGKVICNYDEGFISGVLYEYTKKHYSVVEVDCFGTGANLCRFEAKVK